MLAASLWTRRPGLYPRPIRGSRSDATFRVPNDQRVASDMLAQNYLGGRQHVQYFTPRLVNGQLNLIALLAIRTYLEQQWTKR